MYNFKIAQLHIQGCEEGLFFLNHSSCNSPMVGKIFLGRGRGGKIRAGEGVPSVCNFYGCCWFKDCIFIMIFLINLITALWFHERLGVPDNLYFFFSRNTKIIHSRKSDQGNTSNKSFQNGPKDESNNTLEIIQKPCFLNVFCEATFQILLHSNKITATAL